MVMLYNILPITLKIYVLRFILLLFIYKQFDQSDQTLKIMLKGRLHWWRWKKKTILFILLYPFDSPS